MRAIEIREPGGPDVLIPSQRPIPGPGHGEVLIRIAYAGVNRPDALQRAGSYAPPPGASDLPGLEVSGRVAARGVDVTRWQVGDLLLWDNRCSMHARNDFPDGERRLMLRTTIKGNTRPY